MQSESFWSQYRAASTYNDCKGTSSLVSIVGQDGGCLLKTGVFSIPGTTTKTPVLLHDNNYLAAILEIRSFPHVLEKFHKSKSLENTLTCNSYLGV